MLTKSKTTEFVFWECLNKVVAETCRTEGCKILYSEPLKTYGFLVKRGCKWIIHAKSKESADILQSSIDKIIDDPTYLKGGKKPHLIIKIVEGTDVSLGITRATKSEKCLTRDVIAKIERKLGKLKDDDSPDIAMYRFIGETAMNSLSACGLEQVMAVRHTASSYRLNYYHNGIRHQISLGDILIFIHKTDVDLRANSHRKPRGDRYDSLEPITSFGDAKFYPVDVF